MHTLGVTGGIACGKSEAMHCLKAAGAVCFSADEAARAVLAPESKLLASIVREFGEEILLPNQTLHRAKLAERIFKNPQEREILNSLMHPPIRWLLLQQMRAVEKDFSPNIITAVEIPLLFENGLQKWFEQTVVVTASVKIQKERLAKRDGLTDAQALARIESQWPLHRKEALADNVVHNNTTLNCLCEQLHGICRRMTEQNRLQMHEK